MIKNIFIAAAFWISSFLCLPVSAQVDEKPMVVVIPSYNNKNWYQYNLGSVFTQNYHNYRVIFIDDASPDLTGLLAKSFIKKHNQQERVMLIQNQARRGALFNIYQAVMSCKPDEIIVTLDGDDWLYDDQVLSKLNAIYSDPNVWMTYGQFIHYPCGSPGWAFEVPLNVIAANGIRDYPWATTHLRTFYAELFQKIQVEDLMFNGDFFPMAGDLAFMFPIFEMAGFHSRFIPETLYVYNIETPLSDIKLDPVYQQNLGFLIRQRRRYEPLTHLDFHLASDPLTQECTH